MPTKSFDKLIADLAAIAGSRLFAEIVEEAADAVGLRMVEIALDTYPPEPPKKGPKGVLPRSKSPIHTAKQRRWWWGTMHRIASGEMSAEGAGLRGWKAVYKKVQGRKTLVISGGYKRTGTGIRSMTHEVHPVRGGVQIDVGPSMAKNERDPLSYMQYVLDVPPPDGLQAKIHQDRWMPLAWLIASREDELAELFVDELLSRVYARLRGRA